VISGAFFVTKLGGGTPTYAGDTANSYTGQTTVDEGTLVFAQTAAVAALAGPLVVGDFSGTDTVRVATNFNQTSAQALTVNSSGTFDVSGSAAAQTVGNLEVRGGLVKTTGTNNNTLNVGAAITGLAASTTGATVAAATISGNLALTTTTTVNTADSGTTPALTITAVISGTQSLTKGGAGTLIFNAATGRAAATLVGGKSVATVPPGG
jgi:fibronectin-binding autotransporter adhesin